MTDNSSTPNIEVQLSRRLSLFLLSLYGIGTILGAGIYVLAGKVAGESGLFSPHAFVLAAVVVCFSAYSYAKLSSRFPASAGEAVYISEALHQKWLAQGIGWAIIFTGIVSSATIAKGFAAYMKPYIPLNDLWIISTLILCLCALAIWGVAQAISVAALFTVIEIAGIGLIIWLAIPTLPNLIDTHPEILNFPPIEHWGAIGFGAFLAFYAFIGFEDIVNMAEETKNPKRNLPLAIYISLVVTTLLYFAAALSFIALLPLEDFIGSDAPFANVARSNASLSLPLITFISVSAITNGALIQIIMGSRVLYGMAKRQMAPSIFSQVSARTKTPIMATLVVSTLVLIFALWLPITTLARITSSVVLIIFSAVNLSLLVLEARAGSRKILLPLVGLTLCLSLLGIQIFNL